MRHSSIDVVHTLVVRNVFWGIPILDSDPSILLPHSEDTARASTILLLESELFRIDTLFRLLVWEGLVS